jgi:hypothetical protein
MKLVQILRSIAENTENFVKDKNILNEKHTKMSKNIFNYLKIKKKVVLLQADLQRF